MMYEIKFASQYIKDHKRVKKRGYDLSLSAAVIDKLRDGEILDKKYCDHMLKGPYKGWRECHILPDWLLIYKINTHEKTITVYRTGTHSDLF